MENFVFPDEITTKLMKIEKRKLKKRKMAGKKKFEKNISKM